VEIFYQLYSNYYFCFRERTRSRAKHIYTLLAKLVAFFNQETRQRIIELYARSLAASITAVTNISITLAGRTRSSYSYPCEVAIPVGIYK
jgi:hypothetical protein